MLNSRLRKGCRLLRRMEALSDNTLSLHSAQLTLQRPHVMQL